MTPSQGFDWSALQRVALGFGAAFAGRIVAAYVPGWPGRAAEVLGSMALTVLILHALVRPSKDLRRWWWVQIPLAAAFMLLLEYLWSVHPAAAVAAGIATFLLLFAWHRHRTPQAPPVLRAPGN